MWRRSAMESRMGARVWVITATLALVLGAANGMRAVPTEAIHDHWRLPNVRGPHRAPSRDVRHGDAVECSRRKCGAR